ncbi:MAG: hypothetical protein WBW94_00285 [Anaerolineales bacterium]
MSKMLVLFQREDPAVAGKTSFPNDRRRIGSRAENPADKLAK